MEDHCHRVVRCRRKGFGGSGGSPERTAFVRRFLEVYQ